MKGTILIVDDERNQREILGSILASEGYWTLLAGSGQEALDALEHENVDLVLTDLVMPGMTGEDLIDAILAKTPGTPIILNSAYGTIQTAVEAIKRGAVYYFEEPADRAGGRDPAAEGAAPPPLRAPPPGAPPRHRGPPRHPGDQADPAADREERRHRPPDGGERDRQGGGSPGHPPRVRA